jgi:hypothetical protein
MVHTSCFVYSTRYYTVMVVINPLASMPLSECLHMRQPSLLSGPERFALGGGRSGSCLYYVLCVAALQHCSVHVVFTYIILAACHLSCMD